MFSRGRDPVPAGGALRARHDEVVGGLRRGLLAAQLGALGLPAALEHLRQPVDDDVEKAADAEADRRGAPTRAKIGSIVK